MYTSCTTVRPVAEIMVSSLPIPKSDQTTLDTFIGEGVGVGVFLLFMVCISVVLILVVVVL